MIPHRWWIRASYITTGRPWVTTAELDRPQRAKMAAICAEGLTPGWLARAREILTPGRLWARRCRCRSFHARTGRHADGCPLWRDPHEWGYET